MEILKGFGFEPILFVAQIVNFLLLFIVFKKFLYKPILKILNEREKKIKEGIEDAEKARILFEQAQQEKELLLKKTASEAEKMLNETKKSAAELKESMRQEAKSQSDRIIAEAKSQASIEMEKMQKELTTISLSLSERVLKNIISTLFTQEEQEKVLERAIKALEKSKESPVPSGTGRSLSS